MKRSFIQGVLITALLVLSACSSQKNDVSILLGGDVMLSRAGEALFSINDEMVNPWKNINSILPDTDEKSELFFVNLESPLTEDNQDIVEKVSDMNLCSSLTQVEILKQGQITLATIENNHQDDCSLMGTALTREILEQNGIAAVASEIEPIYYEQTDTKIAVISFDDVTEQVNIEDVINKVQAANEKANLVIVSAHWGVEYQAGPTERQEKLAQQLADAGADIIWGHHPHVLQRMEWLDSSKGGRTLVIYSLGNLLSDQWMLEDAQRTAAIRIDIKNKEISEITIIPLIMDRSTRQLQFVTNQTIEEKIFDRLQIEKIKQGGLKINY